ncbi:MAG: hypothetical protein WDM70_08080 [Nitrosomonadales bacterium]
MLDQWHSANPGPISNIPPIVPIWNRLVILYLSPTRLRYPQATLMPIGFAGRAATGRADT